MSVTHTITRSITRGGATKSASKAIAAGQEVVIDDTVAQSQTDLLYELTIDVSQLKSLYIVSDQDLTLETNADDHAGGDLLTLKANQPVIWQLNDACACPITADVDGLYVTTGAIGADGANLYFAALIDPTV